MKVVHLSTSDLSGGAAIACKRIVDAQASNEIDSNLLVQKKISSDPRVHSITKNLFSKLHYNFRLLFDEGYIRLLTNQNRGRFSKPVFGADIMNHPLITRADIINLHWINGGFISLDMLRKIGKLGKPIFWTFHDMWAFTGGCHYVADCENYVTQCHNCPAVKLSSERDVSYRIFNRKMEIYDKLNLTIVTTSRWLAGEASKSALLKKKKVIVIPTPINSDLFKPLDKKNSRQALNLPLDKKIILFGAMNIKDERKGFRYLIDALQIINTGNELPDIEIAVFGKIDESVINSIPYKVYQLGQLKTESEIISTYNSADVFVAPSLEDNLPNTIMESMACGTPVVAFNIGGIPDMIDDGQNGILTELKSSKSLANGIRMILSDDELNKKFSLSSREKVSKVFNQKVVAEMYFKTYKSFL